MKTTMVMDSFDEIFSEVGKLSERKVVVAGAEEEEAVLALVEARKAGFASGILVGKQDHITAILDKYVQDCSEWDIRDARSPSEASYIAINCLKNGEAQALMKGGVKTGDLMRAVLDKERGLAPKRLLSHLFVFEPPSLGRLLILSDGGMVPRPDLSQKKEIIYNAVEGALALGYSFPKTALLSAFSYPREDLPATCEASILAGLNRGGWLSETIIEGPIPLDDAISHGATILIVPDIESGNFMGKALMYFTKTRAGLVIMGADYPIIVTSRVDNARTRLNSIALSLLIQQRMEMLHASRP